MLESRRVPFLNGILNCSERAMELFVSRVWLSRAVVTIKSRGGCFQKQEGEMD